MIFYSKHQQQKSKDKEDKPAASPHEPPPFPIISSCKDFMGIEQFFRCLKVTVTNPSGNDWSTDGKRVSVLH